jgi:deoxyribonuclease-1
MKCIAGLLFALITTTVFAQQDQKLPDGKWAFYGEEFYTTLAANKKLEKAVISKILNQTHTSTKGKLDIITPDCVNASERNCYKHTSVGYDKARKIMFGELDTLKDAKGTYVLDVYCGKKFYFSNVDTVSSMSTQVNIEHTWPQSRFTGAFSKDQQKSDMHHLYLTDSQANSVRGNSPFGMVTSAEDRMGGEGCRASKMGLIDNSNVYTPPVPHRGNVARSLFYFSMHYNIEISKSEENILREWDKNDPIDANEIRRHEGIAKYEKVRNPFVDFPSLADKVSDF